MRKGLVTLGGLGFLAAPELTASICIGAGFLGAFIVSDRYLEAYGHVRRARYAIAGDRIRAQVGLLTRMEKYDLARVVYQASHLSEDVVKHPLAELRVLLEKSIVVLAFGLLFEPAMLGIHPSIAQLPWNVQVASTFVAPVLIGGMMGASRLGYYRIQAIRSDEESCIEMTQHLEYADTFAQSG